jgi:RHS repeat-associated protein
MSATRVGAAPVQGLQYAYAYDAAGNRTQETVNGGITTYSYNAANELTQVVSPTGTATYTYDAAGNETSNGTDTYSYDALGQLTGATTPTGSYTYVYSGDGLRYEKTGPSGSTRYYWALGETLTETNAQGTVTADNLYGLNLIARTAGGITGFYLYDGHGNVVDVASGSSILDSYRYDPFGNIISQTGSFSNPYLYAGEPYDPETGNYYLESRYYDPATGRFLTPDTLAGNPADPLNLDLYVYVDNNPLTRIDPTGHAGGPGVVFLATQIEQEMLANSQQWETASEGPVWETGTRAWLHEQNVLLANKLRTLGVPVVCVVSGCFTGGMQIGEQTTNALRSNNIGAQIVRTVNDYVNWFMTTNVGGIVGVLWDATHFPPISQLKKMSPKMIRKLGGEKFTSKYKSKSGGPRSNLYWDPRTGRVYAVPRGASEPSDWVYTLPGYSTEGFDNFEGE